MKHGIIIGIQTQKQRDIHAKNFTHPSAGCKVFVENRTTPIVGAGLWGMPKGINTR